LADGEANHGLGIYTEDNNPKHSELLHCSSMIHKFIQKDGTEIDNNKDYITENGSWNVFNGSDACIAEARYETGMILDHVESKDITFYSAVISNSNTDKAYMEHLSSLKCSGNDMGDIDDCPEGDFAYEASTAQEIEVMYTKIIESVLESTTTVTATKGIDSSSETKITPVGQNIELPLPETFACQNKPTLMPIQTIFNGTGTMHFDNITFEYCPTQ
jgi:hypothetical protein